MAFGKNEADLTLILKAKNLASREVDKLHNSLGRATGSAGKFGGALRILTNVGIFGVVAAIGGLIGFLGMAAKAAGEEEKSIAKLDAALRANSKGYTGNMEAIDAVIAKREELAFSDDDLRASLTILVAKYRDVDKALELQATAMDLARLKGISLEEASTMLGRALDGNAKVLKQLGITDLPKAATEQQRLTAIQKVAAGQAEAYGNTMQGAQEAFSIALNDLVEDIGKDLIPALKDIFLWLRNDVLPEIRRFIKEVQQLVRELQGAIKWAQDLIGLKADMPGSNWFNLPMPLQKHAEGGWVGLKGPEMGIVGERGPEYITPNHAAMGGGMAPGMVAVAISARDIARMVDEELYFKLRRAAPTSGRI